MNKLPTTLITIVMLLATAASSMASESTMTSSFQLATAPASLTAPTVLSQKVALNVAELAKYRQLADHSQGPAMRAAAGASSTTKTVLIVVGSVVVVLGVVALVVTHGGHGVPIGNIGSAFGT